MKNYLPTTLLIAATFITGFSHFFAPVQAAAPWTKAADNKIYAQKLADETMRKNPDLLVIGIHAIAPGQSIQKMVASNLDRIGKEDDLDDLVVARSRKTVLAPNLKNKTKFEVQVPLKDQSGRIIGALGLVFKCGTDVDELKLHERALHIREELAKQISSQSSLFKAV